MPRTVVSIWLFGRDNCGRDQVLQLDITTAVTRSPDGTSSKQQKLAYVQSLEARLSAKAAQLAYVKSRVARAADRHRIDVSEQLRNAVKRADWAMATMTGRLRDLQDADDQNIEDLKRDIDRAWEDLANSIKNVVARFS